MRIEGDVPCFRGSGVDPDAISADAPHHVLNLLGGKWQESASATPFPDPLNGGTFMRVSEIGAAEAQPFVKSLQECPKSGLHNPFKNPERYVTYGAVSAKASAEMRKPEVERFFARLIQRVAPKSYAQALGEVVVSRRFLENFSGDQVRYLARSFSDPGDHQGQHSSGWRWPFGPVAVVSPFNFPLEIPLLQTMGALFMGNKVVYKGDSRVSVVMEQALRLLHACGAPPADLDMVACEGAVMQGLLEAARPRVTQFTGSSTVGEALSAALGGRVRLEDAGLDWKILGPDVGNVDYAAWVCDQDAYAFSGQKCSAQSLLFVHDSWVRAGLLDRLRTLAMRRSLEDLTVGPVLTVTTERAMAHVDALLRVPGAEVLFGGKPLDAPRIPRCYGAWEPTAVRVPLRELLKPEHLPVCTREIFGPMQVVTTYGDGELPLVLAACEALDAHLTAAVVSSNRAFQRAVLGATVNGTTYCGARARTTGAPQNHWFGPAGDPRAAGIGTREAIRMVWSCHREIVMDEEPVPEGWTTPPPS
ncbi:aldehyde dehydrogenase [Tribonema minus]|uniref:Aldehyde dehydrogenase n=1 Tax=Tribonema minus TaxID=303371 RepID=A0A835Z7L1_9STRA|nr:aldehyde dehydrogenase [Tribonema minus]